VPPGVSGEICARGYQQMIDYYDMPEATAETVDAEGWLHTGDLGSMDERGYLTITGRLKDMIIRGGENLYPRQIEDRLFAHPAVASVAVVGVPSDTWGEEVAAVLVAKPGETLPGVEELVAWCRETLSPQKTPAHWYGVEALPLTASGKIRKFVLAEQVAAGKLTKLA
jgi:fatty-acyl-CoA synthase